MVRKYLLAHWRGEHGLLRSSLLNGALIYIIIFVALASLGQIMNNSSFTFTGVAIFLLWSVWASVGIFRCGIRNIFDLGRKTSSRIGGAVAIISVMIFVIFWSKM